MELKQKTGNNETVARGVFGVARYVFFQKTIENRENVTYSWLEALDMPGC